MEIDAHHVGKFFDKAFVPRKLESPLLMRLEAVQVPDPLGAVEYDAVAGTLDPRMISA